MTEKNFSTLRKIAEEHSAIRAIAKWIEVELTRQDESEAGVLPEGPLLDSLRSFRDHLERHFRFEEESGLVVAAILVRPQAASNLERWSEEHRTLLARLNDSVRRLEAAPPGTGLGMPFATELRDIFADLRRHEEFENELVGDSRAGEFRSRQRTFEENQA